MTNWIIDDLWLEQSIPWFLPLPISLTRVFTDDMSPMDSVGDCLYPIVDRLVSSNSFDRVVYRLSTGVV
jgi:hypothetical protein